MFVRQQIKLIQSEDMSQLIVKRCKARQTDRQTEIGTQRENRNTQRERVGG